MRYRGHFAAISARRAALLALGNLACQQRVTRSRGTARAELGRRACLAHTRPSETCRTTADARQWSRVALSICQELDCAPCEPLECSSFSIGQISERGSRTV